MKWSIGHRLPCSVLHEKPLVLLVVDSLEINVFKLQLQDIVPLHKFQIIENTIHLIFL